MVESVVSEDTYRKTFRLDDPDIRSVDPIPDNQATKAAKLFLMLAMPDFLRHPNLAYRSSEFTRELLTHLDAIADIYDLEQKLGWAHRRLASAIRMGSDLSSVENYPIIRIIIESSQTFDLN